MSFGEVGIMVKKIQTYGVSFEMGFYIMMLFAAADSTVIILWDDGKLISRCILGSILGSMATVAWLRVSETKIKTEKERTEDVKQFAAEFVIATIVMSMIGGLVSTEPIINYLKWPLNSSTIVPVSAASSFCFIWAMRIVLPLIQSAFKQFVKEKSSSYRRTRRDE